MCFEIERLLAAFAIRLRNIVDEMCEEGEEGARGASYLDTGEQLAKNEP